VQVAVHDEGNDHGPNHRAQKRRHYRTTRRPLAHAPMAAETASTRRQRRWRWRWRQQFQARPTFHSPRSQYAASVSIQRPPRLGVDLKVLLGDHAASDPAGRLAKCPKLPPQTAHGCC
jgi:hypothetical protein